MVAKHHLAVKRIKQIRQNLELAQSKFAKNLDLRNNIVDLEFSKTKI